MGDMPSILGLCEDVGMPKEDVERFASAIRKVVAASVAPSDRRTVVLSLDYDNCMDVLFEGAALRLERRSMKRERTIMEDVRTHLKEYIQRITSGALRVVIMVGS